MGDFDATQRIDFEFSQIIRDEPDEVINLKKVLATLSMQNVAEPPKDYPLYDGINVIGRSQDNQVWIDKKVLSKRHAIIQMESNTSGLIFDLGSVNKTRRGNVFLKPQVRYNLENNDVLWFGNVKTTFKFSVPDDDDETASEAESESLIPDAISPPKLPISNAMANNLQQARENEPKPKPKAKPTFSLSSSDDETCSDSEPDPLKRKTNEREKCLKSAKTSCLPPSTPPNTDAIVEDSQFADSIDLLADLKLPDVETSPVKIPSLNGSVLENENIFDETTLNDDDDDQDDGGDFLSRPTQPLPVKDNTSKNCASMSDMFKKPNPVDRTSSNNQLPVVGDFIGTKMASGGAGGTSVGSGGAGGSKMGSGEDGKAKMASGGAGGSRMASGEAGGSRMASEEHVGAKMASREAGGSRMASGEAGGSKMVSGEAGGTRMASGEAGGTRMASEEAGGTRMASGEDVGTKMASGEAGGTRMASGEAGGSRMASGEAGGSKVASGEAGGTRMASGEAGGSEIASGGAGGTMTTDGKDDSSKSPNKGVDGSNTFKPNTASKTKDDHVVPVDLEAETQAIDGEKRPDKETRSTENDVDLFAMTQPIKLRRKKIGPKSRMKKQVVDLNAATQPIGNKSDSDDEMTSSDDEIDPKIFEMETQKYVSSDNEKAGPSKKKNEQCNVDLNAETQKISNNKGGDASSSEDEGLLEMETQYIDTNKPRTPKKGDGVDGVDTQPKTPSKGVDLYAETQPILNLSDFDDSDGFNASPDYKRPRQPASKILALSSDDQDEPQPNQHKTPKTSSFLMPAVPKTSTEKKCKLFNANESEIILCLESQAVNNPSVSSLDTPSSFGCVEDSLMSTPDKSDVSRHTGYVSTKKAMSVERNGTRNSKESESVEQNRKVNSKDSKSLEQNGQVNSKESKSLEQNGQMNSKKSKSVEQNGTMNSKKSKSLEQNGQVNSKESKSLEQNGQVNSKKSKSLEQNGQVNSKESKSLEQNGQVNSKKPESLEQNGTMNSKKPESLEQNGTMNSKKPESVEQTGKTNSKSSKSLEQNGSKAKKPTEKTVTNKDHSTPVPSRSKTLSEDEKNLRRIHLDETIEAVSKVIEEDTVSPPKKKEKITISFDSDEDDLPDISSTMKVKSNPTTSEAKKDFKLPGIVKLPPTSKDKYTFKKPEHVTKLVVHPVFELPGIDKIPYTQETETDFSDIVKNVPETNTEVINKKDKRQRKVPKRFLDNSDESSANSSPISGGKKKKTKQGDNDLKLLKNVEENLIEKPSTSKSASKSSKVGKKRSKGVDEDSIIDVSSKSTKDATDTKKKGKSKRKVDEDLVGDKGQSDTKEVPKKRKLKSKIPEVGLSPTSSVKESKRKLDDDEVDDKEQSDAKELPKKRKLKSKNLPKIPEVGLSPTSTLKGSISTGEEDETGVVWLSENDTDDTAKTAKKNKSGGTLKIKATNKSTTTKNKLNPISEVSGSDQSKENASPSYGDFEKRFDFASPTTNKQEPTEKSTDLSKVVKTRTKNAAVKSSKKTEDAATNSNETEVELEKPKLPKKPRSSKKLIKNNQDSDADSVKETPKKSRSKNPKTENGSPKSNSKRKSSDSNTNIEAEVTSSKDAPPIVSPAKRPKKDTSKLNDSVNVTSSTSSTPVNKRDSSKKAKATATATRSDSPDYSFDVQETKPKSESSDFNIMFTGYKCDESEKIIASLGGTVTSDINSCTHLITDQFRRTAKFLCAVAKGVPVMNEKWILSAKKHKTLSNFKKFILRDAIAEKKYAFKIDETQKKASEKPLLTGWNVHVTANVVPPPQQMKDIIECAGGKFLAKMPRGKQEKTVIVSCAKDLKLCNAPRKNGIPIVDFEFILTGILAYEIDFKRHKL